jgi:hypothetical protein
MPEPRLERFHRRGATGVHGFQRSVSLQAACVGVALLLAAAGALAAELPAAFAGALREAGLDGEVVSSCSLSSRRAQPQAHAVQLATASGGTYVVVERGRPPSVLAQFQGRGELSCHTPQQARRLHAALARSETLRGALRPRWNTTVVCGFTSATEAACWQYAPPHGRYTRIGGWLT